MDNQQPTSGQPPQTDQGMTSVPGSEPSATNPSQTGGLPPPPSISNVDAPQSSTDQPKSLLDIPSFPSTPPSNAAPSFSTSPPGDTTMNADLQAPSMNTSGSGTPPPAVPPANGTFSPEAGSNKMLIIVAAILVVCVIIGSIFLYLLLSAPEEEIMAPPAVETPTEITTSPIPEAMTEEEAMVDQGSSSDEVADLEADLDQTDLTILDDEAALLEESL